MKLLGLLQTWVVTVAQALASVCHSCWVENDHGAWGNLLFVSYEGCDSYSFSSNCVSFLLKRKLPVSLKNGTWVIIECGSNWSCSNYVILFYQKKNKKSWKIANRGVIVTQATAVACHSCWKENKQ